MHSGTKVAVVGVGAIGMTFAAELWKAGHRDLLLCARRSMSSWCIEVDGKKSVVPVPTIVEPESVTAVDWVFLATKAHQTRGAAPWLHRLCAANTKVVVLQNGVDHEERVRPSVGQAIVLPTIVDCPAEQIAPGYVVQRGPALLIVPESQTAHALKNLFDGSSAIIEMKTDFTTALWEKLCRNLLGAIMAITEEPIGVLRRPDIADLALGLLDETILVACAEGAKIDGAYAKSVLERSQEADPQTGTSILYDRLAGRPLEYEARNEIVVRRAAQHGISVPRNTAIVALLRAISDRASR